MASFGPISGSTVVDDATVGTKVWTNLTLAGASDNLFMTASMADSEVSHYAKMTGFSFTIPEGATIDGIVVSIERKRSRTATDFSVKLVKAGSIVGSDRATATAYTSTDVVENHGGTTDLWGTTWTRAEILDSGFGVVYSAVDTEGAGSSALNCDQIAITVYYTSGNTRSPGGGVSYSQSAAHY